MTLNSPPCLGSGGLCLVWWLDLDRPHVFECQMNQSREGMARLEALCILIFQFSIFFIIVDTVYCCFYTVIKICIAIEIERTLYEYVGGLH